MRRSALGRLWLVLMVASMGSLPAVCGPCCAWETHDGRQALLEAGLSDPWDATPGSGALPGSFMAGTISQLVNPEGDTLFQSVLNTVFYSISTFIESQIDVKNPYGSGDLGRPG